MTVHSFARSKLPRQNMMNNVRLFSRVLGSSICIEKRQSIQLYPPHTGLNNLPLRSDLFSHFFRLGEHSSRGFQAFILLTITIYSDMFNGLAFLLSTMRHAGNAITGQ